MQNGIRDRLIEVIDDKPFTSEYENYNSAEWAEHFADHLIANGVIALDTGVISHKNRPLITHFAGVPMNDVLDLVRAKQEGRIIVPPCKVGDTVYRLKKRRGIWEILSREVVSITHRLDHLHRLVWEIFTTAQDRLGKTVFLTKEEAEKALKERGEKWMNRSELTN